MDPPTYLFFIEAKQVVTVSNIVRRTEVSVLICKSCLEDVKRPGCIALC